MSELPLLEVRVSLRATAAARNPVRHLALRQGAWRYRCPRPQWRGQDDPDENDHGRVGGSAGGAVLVAGRELDGRMPTDRRRTAGSRLRCPEYAVFGRLSVRENLEVSMLTSRDRAGFKRPRDVS